MLLLSLPIDQILRASFINFFSKHGYFNIPSSSIIPDNDPSLFFINAGMAPLKRFFLRQDTPSHNCLTSIQKCVRAGGKHNDLELVGYTKRHHSFFEMCGNFAFSGVSKQDAISIAWKFLTEELHLDPDRLQVTVHPDDHEAMHIWQSMTQRISFDEDNIWSAGDEGPCGMCTEIYYDHRTGDPEDIVEIWNIVFMTHNVRNGVKEELQNMCIDTGIGFERLCAVLCGSPDNYDIPFFKNGILLIEHTSGIAANPSHKVIMDHIRCACFMISAGIMPGNSGRDYVLKRILRRAMRHADKIVDLMQDNINEVHSMKILSNIINYICSTMGMIYPELNEYIQLIHQIVDNEYDQYSRICKSGISQLEEILIKNNNVFTSEDAYKLYDTYGLHIDLIQDVLKEKNLAIDIDEFNTILNNNKHKTTKIYTGIDTSPYDPTIFLGYNEHVNAAQILGIISVNDLYICTQDDNHAYGQYGIIVDATVMYPEGGGQESDHGYIIANDNSWKFNVINAQKYNDVIIHFGNFIHDQENIADVGKSLVGSQCTMSLNTKRRRKLTQHHSATHILLYMLRQKYGNHVIQKGSLVAEDKLRLDVICNETIDICAIERDINEYIHSNVHREDVWLPINDAKESGALCTFGDKYGDIARVVTIGGSKELCIGTHVQHTGEIGSLYIIKQYSIAANIRRIEAVCSMSAYEYAKENMNLISRISQKYKCTMSNLETVLEKKIQQSKQSKDISSASVNIDVRCIPNSNDQVAHIAGDNISKTEMYKYIDEYIKSYAKVFIINKKDDAHMLTLKLSKQYITSHDNVSAKSELSNMVSKIPNANTDKYWGDDEIAHCMVRGILSVNDTKMIDT